MASKDIKPGALVHIVFDDVQHQTKGWSLRGNWPERGRFVAVGYLLKQTKRSTYVANVMDGDYAFCSYTIPTSSIRSMTRLRVK
jgi:hypothetical protein